MKKRFSVQTAFLGAALLTMWEAAFAVPSVDESIAVRTISFASNTSRFAVGVYCARGHDATLRAYLYSASPVDREIAYTIGPRLGDSRNLIITGYGFFGTQVSVIDIEDQAQFLDLITKLPTLGIWHKEYGSRSRPELIDEIDLNGSSLALVSACGA